MDRARSSGDNISTRTNLRETKRHTIFASFTAPCHKPLATYALLSLMKRPCGAAGLRDRATEYWKMATSCRSALIAVSPRPSSFPKQRGLKFNIHPHGTSVRPLTESPLYLLIRRVYLLYQFVHHLAETLAGVRYVADCFETFTYDPVDRKSRNDELQTKRCQARKANQRKRRY